MVRAGIPVGPLAGWCARRAAPAVGEPVAPPAPSRSRARRRAGHRRPPAGSSRPNGHPAPGPRDRSAPEAGRAVSVSSRLRHVRTCFRASEDGDRDVLGEEVLSRLVHDPSAIRSAPSAAAEDPHDGRPSSSAIVVDTTNPGAAARPTSVEQSVSGRADVRAWKKTASRAPRGSPSRSAGLIEAERSVGMKTF